MVVAEAEAEAEAREKKARDDVCFRIQRMTIAYEMAHCCDIWGFFLFLATQKSGDIHRFQASNNNNILRSFMTDCGLWSLFFMLHH